jgi:hypothetical protein
MAIHEPDLRLLRRQIDSLLAQTGVSVRLTFALDGPQEAAIRDWLFATAGEEIEVLPLPERQGPKACFLRGLEAALAASTGKGELYAFCDQDDVWRPDKLARQADFLKQQNASLVHCDARVVMADGTLIHPSLHRMEKRSRDYTLASLIVMNSVTGMTALFDRQTAETAMRIGAAPTKQLLHDHCVALAAALSGTIAFMDEQLVDYTQHDRNMLGASDRSAHRLKLTPFLRPARYIARCREQYLIRVYAYGRVAADAAGSEFLRAHPLRAAERLFGGSLGCGQLLLFAVRKMFRRDFRRSRIAVRCAIGKTAILVQATDRGALGRFGDFLANQAAIAAQ